MWVSRAGGWLRTEVRDSPERARFLLAPSPSITEPSVSRGACGRPRPSAPKPPVRSGCKPAGGALPGRSASVTEKLGTWRTRETTIHAESYFRLEGSAFMATYCLLPGEDYGGTADPGASLRRTGTRDLAGRHQPQGRQRGEGAGAGGQRRNCSKLPR